MKSIFIICLTLLACQSKVNDNHHSKIKNEIEEVNIGKLNIHETVRVDKRRTCALSNFDSTIIACGNLRVIKTVSPNTYLIIEYYGDEINFTNRFSPSFNQDNFKIFLVKRKNCNSLPYGGCSDISIKIIGEECIDEIFHLKEGEIELTRNNFEGSISSINTVWICENGEKINLKKIDSTFEILDAG